MADEPKIPETDDELLLTEVHEPGSEPQPEVEGEGGEEGAEFEIPSFGDETEPQDGDTSLVKHLRQQLKDRDKRLAEIERAPKPATVEIKKPDLWEDCEGDADKYADAIREYDRQVAEARKPEADAEAAAKLQYETERARYTEGKDRLRAAVPDIDEAEETVKSILSREQQSVLVLASDDPAKMVAALAKNPAKLAELAGEGNFFKFAAHVARLEGQMKMVKRRAPAIDAPERGSARMSPQSEDKKLKKLEEEAERTGDRTELIKYRKQRALN